MWKVRIELIIRLIFWRIKIRLLSEERLDEEERKVKAMTKQKKIEKFTCGL